MVTTLRLKGKSCFFAAALCNVLVDSRRVPAAGLANASRRTAKHILAT